MNIRSFLVCFLLFAAPLSAQTIEELFERDEYAAVLKLGGEQKELSAEQMYMVGFSHWQNEHHEDALKFFERSAQAGYNAPRVHFFTGVVLDEMERTNEAIAALDRAIALQPENQTFVGKKGTVLFYANRLQEALPCFEKAVTLETTYPVAYYMLPNTYYKLSQYDQALNGFTKALTILDPKTQLYGLALEKVGLLHYLHTKDNSTSIEFYKRSIAHSPTNYHSYKLLIMAYNAAGNTQQADSLFGVLREKYLRSELSESMMEEKRIEIAEFPLADGSKATVCKYLPPPTEVLDELYRVYTTPLPDKEEGRVFTVERTLPIEGFLYVLCEYAGGSHVNHMYAWKTEDVTIAEVQEGIAKVLEEEKKSKK